ncbi:hypothetical protein [Actinomadura sp. 7K507]|uniref:hypothetical protein n=1 Tax=Actinomadura sp. 7K507 TaxID=2530365 RepID=UPI001051CC3C|nr:hypothetical protein [Actinomadura sp. 7K507]TDC73243.1 hypothetical protein E1285_44765 [Actinomadura sp. 7K507]
MTVTDEQVATLRAQLEGNIAEHRRLLNDLDPGEANVGYSALIAAAFIEAAERRFIKDGKTGDKFEVIDFVAQTRENDDESPNVINPQIAEGMLLSLLGKGSMVDADEETKLGHQIVLLAALVSEEQFTSTELDAFLLNARSLADELLE